MIHITVPTQMITSYRPHAANPGREGISNEPDFDPSANPSITRAADQANSDACETQSDFSKSTFDILALGGFIRITRGQYIEPS
jgi:hypothetical protein